MPDDFANSIDTIGAAPVADAAPAVDTLAVSEQPAADAAGTADSTPASSPDQGEAQSEAPLADTFLDEIDSMGSTESASEPDSKSGDPSLVQNKAADVAPDKTSDTGTSQTKGKTETPDAAPEANAEEGEAETAENTDEDWSKINPETEAYIKKLPSQGERIRARAAERASNMQRSYLNPACPAGQFVDNLAKKSGMRFTEVESEIFKRNIEKDPIGMLTKAFEATADPDGNSESYQRFLDTMVDTNTDYVTQLLQKRGYSIGTGGDEGMSAKPSNLDLSDKDVDEFTDSAAFYQLEETWPEEAAKLRTILDAAKVARSTTEQTDPTKQAPAQPTPEQIAARQTLVNNFTEVYESNITNHVNSVLDKDYGLAVSAEEKEKNPMMAFLKSAKRKLIELGGLDGSGDFDNDLYQWGQSRPAYKTAAQSLVAFSEAGEKDNAATAAKQIQEFAGLFLNERLGGPEVKLMDELIQIVAKHQKASLDTKRDTIPDTGLSRSQAAGGKDSFLDDIDNM